MSQTLRCLLLAVLLTAGVATRSMSNARSSSLWGLSSSSSSPRVLVARHGIISGSINMSGSSTSEPLVLSLRGGDSEQPSKKKKKKKKKSSSASSKKTSKKSKPKATSEARAAETTMAEEPSTTTAATAAPAKKVIAEALQEKDSAEALGDAIRDRADVLRADFERHQSPLLQSIEDSVSSVGYALGTSDRPRQKRKSKGKRTTAPGEEEEEEEEEDESGGVEAAPQSVLANYFLKSHGGAHALQSACSVLSVVSGLAALCVPHGNPNVKLVLLRRTLVLAMTKHVAGLLAAASTAAAAIPHVGLSKARLLLERLAVDPVSQYLFYSALLLVWLPRTLTEKTALPWWWQLPVVPVLLLGPILLREIVSTVLVASDVLVLWTTATSQGGEPRLLRMGQAVVDAFMSLLVTPQLWRNATPASRQALLAKLVSRTSLAIEVTVGALFFVDVGMEWVAALFSTQSAPLRQRILHLVWLRLYGRLLMVRRRKIGRLVKTIRGGAHQVPVRVLDALLDPRAALGLEKVKPEGATIQQKQQPEQDQPQQQRLWIDLVIMALGLDEK